MSSSPARSATPRSGCSCGRSAARPGAGSSTRRCSAICWRAICCRSRATRSPRRCARMPPRRWTCPTGSPAISASSAAPPASAPRSRSARVPLSKAARAALAAEPALIETVLTGGDDFEVVATIPPAQLDVVSARRPRAAGVPVTAIGRVTAGEGGPVPRRRTASRFASRAPHSAISERAGRAIIAAQENTESRVGDVPCTTSPPSRPPRRARPGRRISSSTSAGIRPSMICAAARRGGCRISPSNTATAARATTPASSTTGRRSTPSRWCRATA